MKNKTRIYIVTLLYACLLPLAAAALEDGVTLVELKGESGRYYRIEGAFEVEAPQKRVWNVLTDYAGLTSVVSSMLESRVLQREGDKVLVEQVACGSFLFFKKNIRLLLSINEVPESALQFTETSGKIFRLYSGSWTLSNIEGRVRATYRLDVSSARLAPAFIEKGIFEDNALGLLRELKAEIIRRSATQASSTKKLRS